jgi:hypothetical protein
MSRALSITAMLTISSLGASAVASDFEVSVADAVNLPNCGTLEPSPASGSWDNNTNGSGSSSASAFSTGNGLGGSASATSSGNSGQINRNQACFQSVAFIDDVIVSGPASDVDLQVSAIVNGSVTTSGFNLGDGFGQWIATLKIGHLHGTQIHIHDTQLLSDIGEINGAVSATLTSAVVTLPTGVPLIVELELSGAAIASDTSSDPMTASSSLDFPNGLSFPTSGPVFILPAGFTVNSVDGQIVDNQFVPILPAVPALGGPAAALLALLLAALAARGLTRNVRLG